MNSLDEPREFSLPRAWQLHGTDFLIEGWALGVFMLSAAFFTTQLAAPTARLYGCISSASLRLLLIGVAMGLTAVLLIYSPWGKRSGAHMNPAVTLAFMSLGRISAVNALCYVVAQFLGGLLGVLAAAALLGQPFEQPPIDFIVTVPGRAGAGAAFIAEMAISFGMMFAILSVSNLQRWSRYTGWVAGLLIACYVTFESPVSGMSMNPARTLASALPARTWQGLWIYFAAPLAGMWLAARAFHALTPWVARRHHSAKIVPAQDLPKH
jgi:aquaporin Z